MPAHFNDVNARMSFDDERAKSELSRGIAAAREVSMDDVRVSGAPLHHDDVRRALCAEEEMKNAQAANGASAPMISGKGTSPRRTKKEPLVSDGAGLEVAPSARSVGPLFPPQDERRALRASENVPEQLDCDPTLNGVSPQPEGGRGESQLGESTKSVNQEDLRAEAGGALGGAVASTREPASLNFRREDQDRDQHWLSHSPVRSSSELKHASADVDLALEIMQAQQAAHADFDLDSEARELESGGSVSSEGGEAPLTARVASSSALRLGLSTLLAVLTCSYSIASVAGQSCRQVIYACVSWSDRWCVLEMQPAEVMPLADPCVGIAFTALIALSFVALLHNGTRGRGGGTPVSLAVIAVVIAWVIRPVYGQGLTPQSVEAKSFTTWNSGQTWSQNSQCSGNCPENVLQPTVNTVWHCGSASSCWIEFDFGTAALHISKMTVSCPDTNYANRFDSTSATVLVGASPGNDPQGTSPYGMTLISSVWPTLTCTSSGQSVDVVISTTARYLRIANIQGQSGSWPALKGVTFHSAVVWGSASSLNQLTQGIAPIKHRFIFTPSVNGVLSSGVTGAGGVSDTITITASSAIWVATKEPLCTVAVGSTTATLTAATSSATIMTLTVASNTLAALTAQTIECATGTGGAILAGTASAAITFGIVTTQDTVVMTGQIGFTILAATPATFISAAASNQLVGDIPISLVFVINPVTALATGTAGVDEVSDTITITADKAIYINSRMPTCVSSTGSVAAATTSDRILVLTVTGAIAAASATHAVFLLDHLVS